MPDDILSIPPPPADLRATYGKESSQFVDFRFPASNPAAAIVIMIHGGFWRQRYDLAHAGHLCAALTADGLTTANIEYRRVGEPGGGWPGMFDDIQAALESVRMRHGGDKPVVVVGHSAGGHLSLLTATQQQGLAGVVALAPVACLRTAWQQRLGDGAVAELLGGPPEAVPERYVFACPSLHRARAPRVLIHGTADDIVPLKVSHDYLTARSAESDVVRLVELPGADHFDLIDPRSASWGTVVTEIKNMADTGLQRP
jgi:acetyl esterase/lipase